MKSIIKSRQRHITPAGHPPALCPSAFFALAAVFFLFSVSACASSGVSQQSPEVLTPTPINSATVSQPLDNSHLRLLGRSTMLEDCVFMGYSCTGAEFNVHAKRLDVTISGDSGANVSKDNGFTARICAFVNGERLLDKMILEQNQTFTIFDAENFVEGVVQIIKVSECSNSLAAISEIKTDSDGIISATEEKSLKIEFIGDSITCAYGVDDLVKEHHFTTSTQDATKSYAYKTAQKLNADYSFVSISGWGVLSGYSGDDKKNSAQILPVVYDKLGYTYAASIFARRPQDIEWDFSRFQPDFVVINLGTNDSSYTKGKKERIQEYQDVYISFIKDVRAKNSDAFIICSLGVMGQDLCSALEQAVEVYMGETSDEKICSLRYAQQSMSDGIAADWHPSEKTHEKTAVTLTAKINSILGK